MNWNDPYYLIMVMPANVSKVGSTLPATLEEIQESVDSLYRGHGVGLEWQTLDDTERQELIAKVKERVLSNGMGFDLVGEPKVRIHITMKSGTYPYWVSVARVVEGHINNDPLRQLTFPGGVFWKGAFLDENNDVCIDLAKVKHGNQS
jgi:hypothetical protein